MFHVPFNRSALAYPTVQKNVTAADLPEIMKYGVMSTPGVVVDGKVVHAGGVPDRVRIAGWL
jgi:predicted thioredoxin/glutaredoxin